MFETLSGLFFAHVLADYVFQTSKMAQSKDRVTTLLVHTLVVYLCAVVALGSIAWPIAVLAGLHMAIDALKAIWVKTRKDDGIKPYLTDQLTHLVTLAAIAAFAPTLWADGVWTKDLASGGLINISAWAPKAMLLTAGILYTTRAGGFAVGKLMQPFITGAPKKSLPKGGMMIGLLERGLIFLMFLAGQPAGIGFLIAAKSVLRFDAASKNEKAEYVIIGTLASFSWAIAIAILTLAINNGLNGDPLLEIMAAKP
ncbi:MULTISPECIES: DUF3307 domain-containing protein [Pacificibacter]|uniref:DUF3307 domain-containing protein n=1 Tax=Pacificibacter TaxID=1042323 RepID=UPI001C08825D|nr:MULTISPECIES: DUF3307 domain-containing protein [Pacificibacter]MBU2936270.1 DUF3307 domain-containing protein [Pacificibacter marinus]MDO6616739.1 DUF3307 domain-containing protein [Pacificibacter sp. 1_MG-2023]